MTGVSTSNHRADSGGADLEASKVSGSGFGCQITGCLAVRTHLSPIPNDFVPIKHLDGRPTFEALHRRQTPAYWKLFRASIREKDRLCGLVSTIGRASLSRRLLLLIPPAVQRFSKNRGKRQRSLLKSLKSLLSIFGQRERLAPEACKRANMRYLCFFCADYCSYQWIGVVECDRSVY
jgi:hypothetical protein